MPIVGPNCMGIYNRRLGVKFTGDQQQGEGGNVLRHLAERHARHRAQMLGRSAWASRSRARSRSATRSSSMRRTTSSTCATTRYEVHRDVPRRREGRPPLLQRAARGDEDEAGRDLEGRSAPRPAPRAARSHTASLASPSRSGTQWRARRTPSRPSTIDETLDVAAALEHTDRPTKRGIALIAMTGGQSVAITDAVPEGWLRRPAALGGLVPPALRVLHDISAARTATHSTRRAPSGASRRTCARSSTSSRPTPPSTAASRSRSARAASTRIRPVSTGCSICSTTTARRRASPSSR